LGNILAGRSGISRLTGFDVTDYPCKIGAEIVDFDAAKLMNPKEARGTTVTRSSVLWPPRRRWLTLV